MFFAFKMPKERDFVHFSGLGDLSGGRSLNSYSGQDKSGGVDKPFPGLIDGRAERSDGALGRVFHASTYLHDRNGMQVETCMRCRAAELRVGASTYRAKKRCRSIAGGAMWRRYADTQLPPPSRSTLAPVYGILPLQ